MYSLHRTGVGVCLNELEGVPFASSKNSVPREGTVHCNDKF